MADTNPFLQFHAELNARAIDLLKKTNANDFSSFLTNTADKMHPSQLRHLAAAIDLTTTMLHHDALATQGRQPEKSDAALMDLARTHYSQAVSERYSRHADKGERYYEHLTDEFMQKMGGLIKSGTERKR